MKTIVLFSRCELVHLYAKLSKQLVEKYKIIHLAYSQEEAEVLEETYKIKGVICFEECIREIFESKSHLEINIEDIDRVLVEQTNGRFNLNGAIQSDRTFEFYNYLTNLELSQLYFKFWTDFILEKKVAFLIHEPTTLFLNHIASVICKLNNAKYITFIQVYGESDFNFAIIEGDNGGFSDIKAISSVESEFTKNRISNFLTEFRVNSNTFLDVLVQKNKQSFFKQFSFSILCVLKIIYNYFSSRLKLLFKKYTILDHLEFFHLKSLKLIEEINNHFSYYYRINYHELSEEDSYYYYPLHLEPEAVVLYWGDGLYKNQVKLIENIAAQLPANKYLYVKDHPHAGAYRDYNDYIKIQSISNVKLLHPKVVGKKIIINSIGVITINGTSGFEALLLNKQVYTFGNCFFNECSRVNHIKNIKDLREILYINRDMKYKDDEELYNFVNIYLNSTHPGFTNYFMKQYKLIGIDEDENSKIVANELSKYFDNF